MVQNSKSKKPSDPTAYDGTKASTDVSTFTIALAAAKAARLATRAGNGYHLTDAELAQPKFDAKPAAKKSPQSLRGVQSAQVTPAKPTAKPATVVVRKPTTSHAGLRASAVPAALPPIKGAHGLVGKADPIGRIIRKNLHTPT